jgi:hypothetical protein
VALCAALGTRTFVSSGAGALGAGADFAAQAATGVEARGHCADTLRSRDSAAKFRRWGSRAGGSGRTTLQNAAVQHGTPVSPALAHVVSAAVVVALKSLSFF